MPNYFLKAIALPLITLTLLASCYSEEVVTRPNTGYYPGNSSYRRPPPVRTLPDGYYYSPRQPRGGGYQYYPAPASREYSNPYAFPPQNYYPYYDGDQYYRPPTYYGTSGDNPPQASDNKY